MPLTSIKMCSCMPCILAMDLAVCVCTNAFLVISIFRHLAPVSRLLPTCYFCFMCSSVMWCGTWRVKIVMDVIITVFNGHLINCQHFHLTWFVHKKYSPFHFNNILCIYLYLPYIYLTCLLYTERQIWFWLLCITMVQNTTVFKKTQQYECCVLVFSVL